MLLFYMYFSGIILRTLQKKIHLFSKFFLSNFLSKLLCTIQIHACIKIIAKLVISTIRRDEKSNRDNITLPKNQFYYHNQISKSSDLI